MKWELIEPALTQLTALLMAPAQLPLDAVCWKGSFREGSTVIGARVVLSASPERTIGSDEEFRTANEQDDQTVTISGPREFTWTVFMEADNKFCELYGSPRRLIDKLCTRLRRRSVTDSLARVELGYSRTIGKSFKDFLGNGRGISYATADILLLGVENDTDTTIGAGGYIDRATGTVAVQQGETTVTATFDADASDV